MSRCLYQASMNTDFTPRGKGFLTDNLLPSLSSEMRFSCRGVHFNVFIYFILLITFYKNNVNFKRLTSFILQYKVDDENIKGLTAHEKFHKQNTCYFHGLMVSAPREKVCTKI